MKLADVSVNRPVFAVMMSAALLVMGWFSYRQLGLDLMPKTDYPTVTVCASLPGASAEEVETSITKPIESAVNTINGIDELRCSSSQGFSRCSITFVLEREIEAATQDVRDKVAGVQRQFPRDTQAGHGHEDRPRLVADPDAGHLGPAHAEGDLPDRGQADQGGPGDGPGRRRSHVHGQPPAARSRSCSTRTG